MPQGDSVRSPTVSEVKVKAEVILSGFKVSCREEEKEVALWIPCRRRIHPFLEAKDLRAVRRKAGFRPKMNRLEKQLEAHVGAAKEAQRQSAVAERAAAKGSAAEE